MEREFPDPAVSASVSCMDLGHMADGIRAVEAASVDFFHYDVVDGRFNSCYILGDLLFQYIKKHGRLPVEVHLAVETPAPYIDVFAALGADYIAVHYETADPRADIERIRQLGAEPVLAYRAETAPGEDFTDLARDCAWILKLTVNPGFSGQAIHPAAVGHIRQMRDLLDEQGLAVRIQADGSVNRRTTRMLAEAGASIFTGGSSGLFLPGRSLQENIDELLCPLRET